MLQLCTVLASYSTYSTRRSSQFMKRDNCDDDINDILKSSQERSVHLLRCGAQCCAPVPCISTVNKLMHVDVCRLFMVVI